MITHRLGKPLKNTVEMVTEREDPYLVIEGISNFLWKASVIHEGHGGTSNRYHTYAPGEVDSMVTSWRWFAVWSGKRALRKYKALLKHRAIRIEITADR